jgi:hypothetical protein
MTKRHAHLSVNHKQAAVERISGVQSAIKTASIGFTGYPGKATSFRAGFRERIHCAILSLQER